MPDHPGLNYGELMQRALRGMMAEALGIVAESGLPGEHHFYISIDTTHPGVDIPGWLRERHPREITIVLQYEFEDLAVLGDRFTVSLSFSNRRETLVIPFAAVKTFIDPSVELALKFDGGEDSDGVAEFEGAAGPGEDTAEAVDEPPHTAAADGDGGDDPDGDGAPSGPASGQGSADVVSLDKFRKT